MPVNLDTIAAALAVGADRIIVDKASIANQTAGTFCSLWRATGQPAQGAIPGTTPAIPTKATTGAMNFTNQTAPIQNHLLWAYMASGNAAMTLEIWDRVAHMGGLVLNVTTQQNISGMNLATLGVPAARLGEANYSDVQWFLETYTDGGSTAANATINVTYDDDSTGNLNTQAVGGTLRASRLLPLTPLIPTAQQGKFIKGINSVTLSASTGTAGSFGFTAVRPRAALPLLIANKTETFDWAQLGIPVIPNDACLMLAMLTSTTSSGTLRGGGKIGAVSTT
jgi:hypothetical protein